MGAVSAPPYLLVPSGWIQTVLNGIMRAIATRILPRS
jgi:hypothetical protein